MKFFPPPVAGILYAQNYILMLIGLDLPMDKPALEMISKNQNKIPPELTRGIFVEVVLMNGSSNIYSN